MIEAQTSGGSRSKGQTLFVDRLVDTLVDRDEKAQEATWKLTDYVSNSAQIDYSVALLNIHKSEQNRQKMLPRTVFRSLLCAES